MGAGKPDIIKAVDKRQTSISPLLIGGALLIVALVALTQVHFSGTTDFSQLSPKEQKQLEKRFRELDDSEQYALVASVDGFYTCLHSGWSSYYLKAGEVWKYGVTSKGVFGRYTASFLFKNKVLYIAQFKGNISECLKMEQVKLFNYPYSAENLARPPEKRLPRPPYNPIMR